MNNELWTLHQYFAGAGMAGLGLGRDFACTFANDIDPKKGRSYAANCGEQGLVVGDVAHLKPADLPGVADLAWASPPCQDVSLAGDRVGLNGTRSSSFWPFWKLMQALRVEGCAPRVIAIENVCGLLTSHEGKDFDAICSALTDAGYRFGAMVIDAEHFLPQSRPRVFVVAVDAGVTVPAGIVVDRPCLPFHPPLLVAACERQRSAPIWFKLSVPPRRNLALVDLIEDEPQGVAWHTRAETDRLIEMMSPINLDRIESAKRAGELTVGALYRRIRPGADGKKAQRAEVRFDGLAGCLRVPTGGSSRQTILIIEGALVKSRLLSPREAARLMGLPEVLQAALQLQRGLRLDRRRRGCAGRPAFSRAHS